MSANNNSNPMSAKEREILTKQRQLAARLKKQHQQAAPNAASSSSLPSGPSTISTSTTTATLSTSKGGISSVRKPHIPGPPPSKPPPPPRLPFSQHQPQTGTKKTVQQLSSIIEKERPVSLSSNNNNLIDLTEETTLSNSEITKSTAAATTTTTTTTAPEALIRPIRPTLKNKLQQKQNAMVAKQMAQQAQEAAAVATLATHESSPLPAVAKKKNKNNEGAENNAKTTTNNPASLAQLVQTLSTLQNVDPDSVDMFPTIEPEDFWKHLREWDFCSQYYNTTQQQQQQSLSKTADNTANVDSISTTRPLPNIFLSAKQYIALWAPLCLAECRAQLLQEIASKRPQSIPIHAEVLQETFRGNSNKAKAKDASVWDALSSGVDAAIHIKVNALQRNYGPRIEILPNDLVLLLPEPNFFKSPRDNVSGFVGHAEVPRKEISNLIIKVSKIKWAKYGKTEGLHLVLLGSNVTAWREFTALTQIQQLPLKRYLLGEHLETGNVVKKLSTSYTADQLLEKMGGQSALGNGFIEYATKKFNPSQLSAIAASAHEYGEGGFTLIKGPPGTGKTTTLVAVLNSLHIRQYNKYYSEVVRIATQSSGSRQNALQMARKAKPRLLVCAPSNAAVDNIILKIMQDGFIDGQGQRYNPSMIRVGVGQSAAVRAVALETKVDTILGENLDLSRLDATIAAYRVEISRVTQDIHKLRDRLQTMTNACQWPLSRDWEIRVHENGRAYFVNHKDKTTTFEVPPPPEPDETQFPASSMPEYRNCIPRIVKLVEQYFSIKMHLERCTIMKAGQDQGTNHYDLKQNLETHVLNDVHLVMTTLGTAGNRILDTTEKFEVVVVDEAAQSVEPATLAALQLGSRHAVLVGDPQQLPATIFNVSGRLSKFDRSLFQRLEEAGQPVYMLQEQYRMHPAISHFPRHIFYGGTLLDGPNVTQPTYGNRLQVVLNCAVPLFKPFTILDLDSTEERGGTSLSNRQEALLCVFLYQQLRNFGRDLITESKVAIITPYAQQVNLLRRLFTDTLGDDYERFVEINSVDAFQGREANIVIFSAVRAAGSKGIGFLSDVRRMNVALTRAKFFLFVIARCESIVVNPYWRDLVQHARETQAVLKVSKINTHTFESPVHWKLENGGKGVIRPCPPPLLLEEEDSMMMKKRPPSDIESYTESTPSVPELGKKPVDPRLAATQKTKKARRAS